MLLSTLHLRVHQMDVDDIISPGSYFAAKQSKTQGKNAPKHSLKQECFPGR